MEGNYGRRLNRDVSLTRKTHMKKKLNWIVLEGGDIVACFVSRSDAMEFVNQCGSASMKTAAASAPAAKELRQYCPLITGSIVACDSQALKRNGYIQDSK